MKKQMIFAAAALMFAACSNDESMDNWNGEIRLASSLSVQETNTRAATDVQDDAFATSEYVDVFINEVVAESEAATTQYDQPLTYTTGASGAMNPPAGKQPYYPTSGNGVNIYAVYPANVSTSFSINPDQSGDGTNYKASDLMYGKPSNTTVNRTPNAVTVTFKHLLSKVTITLVAGNGLTDADLTDAKVTLLGVMPTIGFTPSTGALGDVSGNATNVVVKSASDTNLSNSAIVVPQNLGKNFVQVDLADGGTLTGCLDDNATPSLASGNEYTYTITVNLTALNIVSEIADWNSNTGSGTATMQ